MIRRSPCEYYLKYLLVHPDGYTNEQIRNIVKLQQLDFIGIPYLERLRASCVPPLPFYPHNPRHRRSQRFLIREGLRAFFITDLPGKQAHRLLDIPRAKEIIESCILSGMTDSWTAAAVKKIGYACNAKTIERYRHFFFNPELVDSTEMKALMEMRTMSVQTDDPEVKAANMYLDKARYSDPRRMASRMSVMPVAGLLNQLRLGIMPSGVELARIASAARTAATARVLEEILQGGNHERAQGYALTAKLMTEVLESVGDVEEELYSELQSLVLETEATEVPHIKQLSGGEHTVELQPLQLEEANAE